MKKNTASFSTTVFNLRLFLEGLKRLRVIGLATAILTITASALFPIAVWMERQSYKWGTYEMDTELLCIPAGCMVFLAPFFFFVLFSFLQKRKQSDFFHAIPYTRTCVYISFTAAALAFVWAIQLACGAVSGILWSMVPRLTADIGAMMGYVCICMLAAAMLSSFMMLSLTVSGTAGSCILLFVLFAGFTRVVAAIFLGCLETVRILPTDSAWQYSPLSPLWFLPINVINYFASPASAARLMYSLPNLLYSIAVTLVIFALAGFLYRRRQSEMAGNPAPGVRSQALFRILFTLIPALLTLLILVQGNSEPSVMLVMTAVVLLVYFLYELITTKRPRNMLKAIPGLGIVVLVCLLFVGSFLGYRAVVLHEDVSAERVESVAVDADFFGRQSYAGYLLAETEVRDSEMIELVTQRLATSQRVERGVESWEGAVNFVSVTIRLKSGRVLKRNVRMSEQDLDTLIDKYASLEEYRDLYCRLPEAGEVRGVELRLTGSDGYRDYFSIESRTAETKKAFLDLFASELSTLSAEQKKAVMSYTFQDKDDSYKYVGLTCVLRGYTAQGNEHFYSTYVITDDLPQTRRALLTLCVGDGQYGNHFDCAGKRVNGSVRFVLSCLEESAAAPAFAQVYPYLKGICSVMSWGTDTDVSLPGGSFLLAAEDIPAFVRLLTQSALTSQNVGESPAEEDTLYYLCLETDMESKGDYFSLQVRSLFRFTPETWEELTALLTVEENKIPLD